MNLDPVQNDQDGQKRQIEENLIEQNNTLNSNGNEDRGGGDGFIEGKEVEQREIQGDSNLALTGESQSETIPPSQHDDINEDMEQSTKVKDDESQPGSTIASLSSPGLASAIAVKKFNSLSVAKQFLQKASPTLGNSSAAPLSSVKGNAVSSTNASLGGSSKLSSMMPASRLTSAKLTNSFKPAGAGWAQVTPANTATAQINDPNPSPAVAAASASGSGNGPNPSSSITENSAISASANTPAASIPAAVMNTTANVSNTSTVAAPSPRLVTALSNRSTSPHIRSSDGSKGSPGLRNAAISGMGRTNSPSTTNSTSTSVRAPWASVKKDAPISSSSSTRAGGIVGKRTEFPTAAEAAQAKIDAEKKEKAAAAEAALKAEQALQNLEKFRGTTLGTHWDEMDDDDFGDGELRFGDGSSYKVKPPEKEVSKEERFKDVGHDRSWPPQSGTTQSDQTQQRKQTTTATTTKPSKPEHHHPERVKPHKVETVAVRSGEGISLDAPSSMDRPHSFYSGSSSGQQKERRSSFLGRQKEHPREEHGHHRVSHDQSNMANSNSTQTAPPVSSQIRAWGPLAQRQASLNPDAPKPTTAPTPASSSSKTADRTESKSENASKQNIQSTLDQSRSKKPTSSHPTVLPPHIAQNQSTTGGRALPPHLALRQAQTSQVEVGSVERPDWRTAVPRPLQETVEDKSTPSDHKEVIARPYGSIIASARQNQGGGVATAAADSIEDRSSALERARKRKEMEEEERKRERERALAKAAAIETKMREAQEAEDRKKRLAEEESQRRAKAEEEERQRRIQQSRSEPRGDRQPRSNQNAVETRSNRDPPRGSRYPRPSQAGHEEASDLQISTTPSERAVTSLLSPSDEAVSWRRPKNTFQSVAPGNADEKVKQDIQPQKVLLRRAEATPPASRNKTENVNATSAEIDQQSLQQQRRSGRASVKNENEDIKRRSERSRVEIIAPTDEGAAKHMHAAQQREREARQNRDGSVKVPVGVLKSNTNQKDIVRPIRITTPEPEQTRSEVPFDGVPVWNKFQVRIGRRLNKPFVRMNKEDLRAQQSRIAKAKDQSGQHTPKSVSILSWTPPILDLPARTLSRDDQFFPKRYRKGVRIANVILPSTTMAQLTDQRLKEGQQSRKKFEKDNVLDSQSYIHSTMEADETPASKPSVRIPSSHYSNNNNKQTSEALNVNSIPIAPRQQRQRDVNGAAVAFARSTIRESSTPSPVNFTMQSELDHSRSGTAAPAVLLGNKGLTTAGKSSTWGENSLTFADSNSKDISQSGSMDAEVERNRIKDAWVSLPSDAANQTGKPIQNSLRDIGDLEIPSAISMSMHDLRADDVPSESLAQMNDEVRNVTTKSVDTHLYTPLKGNGTDNNSPNNRDVNAAQKGLSEFSMMTAASSPINVASPNPTQTGQHLFGGGFDSADRRANLHHQIGRARSQSPSSMRYAASIADAAAAASKTMGNANSPSAHLLNATSTTTMNNNRGAFLQQERGGARAAFGPYAYPNTAMDSGTYSSDMSTSMSQQLSQPHQQQQQYAAYGMGTSQTDGYETGYGAGYDNSFAYSNRQYRSGNGGMMSSNMSSGRTYDAFGNPMTMQQDSTTGYGNAAYNDRSTFSNTSNLFSAGGNGGRREGGYGRTSTAANTNAFGEMMGSEASALSGAGWPLDSSSGSYMGNSYTTPQQHPNTSYYATTGGYESAVNNSATIGGSSGYENVQQSSGGMHSMSSPSMYNRSFSQQHNRFGGGSSNYRGGMGGGGNNMSMSNGHHGNTSSGQWGNRNSSAAARSYGTGSSSFGSGYQQQQHNVGNSFDSNSFPRNIAGSTLQATAKPFQFNANEGSRSSSHHQSYPRSATNTAAAAAATTAKRGESGTSPNSYGMNPSSYSYNDGGNAEQRELIGGDGGNYDANAQW